jgi:ATP-dependent Clp protease ATP-binding subunit ClpC
LYASAPGEQIEVQFVDPNLPADQDGEADTGQSGGELELRALALAGGRGEATPFLLDALTQIQTAVAGPIAERKQRALAQMQEHGFWERSDRHQLLSEIEYLDRLESATEGAGRLARRLAHRNGNDANEFTRLLATRLYVLEAALTGVEQAAPADLYLRLRATADSEPAASERCCDQLADMYTAWAAARGRRLQSLDQQEQLYLVSGLGAWIILAPEAGLHVFELYTGAERRAERVSIRCEIAPCAPTDLLQPNQLAQRALDALRDQPGVPAVVRRYRGEPSPLVRDAARGYRTGRLELVLAGAFDLL